MALLWLDSFDHYASGDVGEKYPGFGGTINATGGRRSSGAITLGNFGAVQTRNLAPASTTAIVGVAGRAGNLASSGPYIRIYASGTVQASLNFNPSGFAVAYRGDGATALGTATTGAIVNAVYAFIEFKVVVHPSAGTVTVRVNGATVLSLTGVNTAASGVAAWDSIGLKGDPSGLDYDDFYVLDGSGAAPTNDLIGDCRVDARYPTAEGALSAWAPLSGSDNALMVDDPGAPDDDTTYNSTATVGATDTHIVQDVPVPGAPLYGVQLSLSLKKTSASPCSVAPVVRHSGTNYPGTAVNPNTSYAFAVTPYGLNPGTGAAWTEAGFNAAEFGYTRTA